jgi:hypothetical protein
MAEMSPNKKLVQRYYASKGTVYARLLAEDVVLVDWDPGVSLTGAVTKGKAAYVQNRGHRESESEGPCRSSWPTSEFSC